MRKFFHLLLLLPTSIFGQELDLEAFIRANFGLLPDTQIARQALDSMQYRLSLEEESGLDMFSANVVNSDDGIVTVYQFLGEGCGAYCNPVFLYAVAIRDSVTGSPKIFSGDMEFSFELDSILSLGEQQQYLAFGNTSGRPRGIEINWGNVAALYQFRNNDVEEVWAIRPLTSNLVDLESAVSEISYDAGQGLIHYRHDWYDEFEEFRAYRAHGTWRYTGQTFDLIEETKDFR
jgi:hypothetical protein